MWLATDYFLIVAFNLWRKNLIMLSLPALCFKKQTKPLSVFPFVISQADLWSLKSIHPFIFHSSICLPNKLLLIACWVQKLCFMLGLAQELGNSPLGRWNEIVGDICEKKKKRQSQLVSSVSELQKGQALGSRDPWLDSLQNRTPGTGMGSISWRNRHTEGMWVLRRTWSCSS